MVCLEVTKHLRAKFTKKKIKFWGNLAIFAIFTGFLLAKIENFVDFLSNFLKKIKIQIVFGWGCVYKGKLLLKGPRELLINHFKPKRIFSKLHNRKNCSKVNKFNSPPTFHSFVSLICLCLLILYYSWRYFSE